jgi:hypothetical protein
LWYLFSAVAFPIHVWAILLFLQDFSWLAERTNTWDAVGVGAYSLSLALIESGVVFLVAALLGLLISTKWDQITRVALMGTLVIIVSFWAILGQLWFLWEWSLPTSWIVALANQAHPLRILYLATFAIVFPTVVVATIVQFSSSKINRLTYEFFDRLSLLITLYLFLDLVSIIIVIIRNL